MNNLLLRAITGFFFVASILLSVWYNKYLAFGVFSLFFIAGVFEYANLFKNSPGISLNRSGFIILSLISYALVLVCLCVETPPISLIIVFPPLIFLFMLSELWRKQANAIANIAVGVMGFFYLVLPFSFILILAADRGDLSLMLLGMFLLIWTNDTFAYLTGRFIGKTKLFERISPKKTWEGTLGGVFFTIIVAVIINESSDVASLTFWLVAACIVAPMAIFGDLLESLFKRSLNIKDSGTILPGHGGILDRFDATLFTVPFFFSWIVLYRLFF